MRYHVIKSSRTYTGEPYKGPSSDESPAEAGSMHEAIDLAIKMYIKNPVGWDVYDSESEERIFSTLDVRAMAACVC